MKVVIRTDASVEIGSGHLMRCLTLADQLRTEGAQVAFVCRDLPGALFELLQNQGYPHAKLPTEEFPSQERDAEETLRVARKLFPKGFEWLVVDHYGLDAKWERMLRHDTTKIMVIDDLADRYHDCDLLLDQNYYRDLERRYQGLVPDTCVSLLGPSYVLLRQEFADARKYLRTRDGSVRRILVFFGGTDPTNQTQKVIEALRLLERPDIYVDVIVGATNPHRKVIENLCKTMPNLVFHCQIANMAELILSADLGVGAGGAAMWERCYLGLPTLTVVFAANQERTTVDVADTGAIKYLGWATKLDSSDYAYAISEMIEHPQMIQEVSNMALKLLQHAGSSLVVDRLCQIKDSDTCTLSGRAF